MNKEQQTWLRDLLSQIQEHTPDGVDVQVRAECTRCSWKSHWTDGSSAERLMNDHNRWHDEQGPLRRWLRRALVVLVVAVAALWVARATAAPPSVQRVVQTITDQYRAAGYVLPNPVLRVATLEELNRYAYPGMTSDGFAGGGEIALRDHVYRQVLALARVASKPLAQRARAYRACDLVCSEAQHVLTHEIAHEVQGRYGALSDDRVHTEGVADAVALDLFPAIQRRLIGKRLGPSWYWQPELRYHDEVVAVRELSAAWTGQLWTSAGARAWRMGQLGVAP